MRVGERKVSDGTPLRESRQSLQRYAYERAVAPAGRAADSIRIIKRNGPQDNVVLPFAFFFFFLVVTVGNIALCVCVACVKKTTSIDCRDKDGDKTV